MTDPKPERARLFRALPLAQREVALLLVLSAVASVLFVATRLLAGWSRRQQASEAATWYVRGETALHRGATDAGIDALRRAVGADHGSVPYALALAQGLAEGGRTDEAWRILQRLREDGPEDAEINHRLARLAVTRGDLTAAARYYHNAMYGIASSDRQLNRHAIALELAGVLIEHGHRDNALAELIALAADLDASAPEQLSVATLFLRAGDASRARAHFLAAAKSGSETALAGAADAAVAEHDFPAAEQYLRDAAKRGVDVAAQLRTVRLVLALDPLARRIPPAERSRRLAASLQLTATRLASCRIGDAGNADLAPLEQDLARFRAEHTSADLRNTDVIEQGVALIVRGVAATPHCGASDPDVPAAWRLIGEAHGAARP